MSADGRPRAGAARGHAPLAAGAGRARPQGRVPQGARRAAEARASSASRSTARSTRSRDAPKLDKKFKHDIDVVVDRLVVRARHRARASPTASRPRSSSPTASPSPSSPTSRCPTVRDRGPTNPRTRRTSASCSRRGSPARSRGFTIAEIEPRLFSFNKPVGACPACDGLGTELRFEPDLVVPDADAEPARGRDHALGEDRRTSPYYEQTLEALAKHYKVSIDDAVGEAAQARAARDPVRHRATRRSTSSTRTARATTRRRSRSRA